MCCGHCVYVCVSLCPSVRKLTPVWELPGGWGFSTPHLMSLTPVVACACIFVSGSDVTPQIAKNVNKLNFLVNTRGFKSQNAPKPVFGRGSASYPAGGAYDAPHAP